MKFERMYESDGSVLPSNALEKIYERHGRIKSKPCWTCGSENTAVEVIDGRAVCPSCLPGYRAEKKAIKERMRSARYETMRETVYDIYDTQLLDIYEYRDAIETVYESTKEGRNYDSAPEMAVAAMLISNRIKIKTQFSVGRRRADFYLPAVNVALEIDGERHDPKKDVKRDMEMISEMGGNFDVVHVPEHYVRSNLRNLPYCIVKAIEVQREIAKKHNGNIPASVRVGFTAHRDIWNRKDIEFRDIVKIQ